ncbi:MAG: TolC family protein [Pseudomonadales bacterium]
MILPIMYRTLQHRAVLCCGLLLGLATAPLNALTLAKAEQLALANEPGISNIRQQALALRDIAVADGQLPDPELQIGGLNLPTDTFDLDQEPMTQIRVAMKQEFPAGGTLAMRKERTLFVAEGMDFKAQERRLAVLRELRTSWYEAVYWQDATDIYAKDRGLFAQLLDTTRSLYRVGRKGQQDVIRAELEISQLNDRLLQTKIQRDIQHNAIARWVGPAALASDFTPRWATLETRSLVGRDHHAVAQTLQHHPLLQSFASQVKASEQSLDLAKESYKPRWALELGYGIRDGDNLDRSDRADFLSLVATVQMPLFTAKRQDKVASARVHQRAASHDAHMEALRTLTRDALSASDRWRQLSARLALYQEQILPRARLQAGAALAAYQADTSDFAELMRAYLDEQQFRLQFHRLRAEQQQALSTLHYLLPSATDLEDAQ